MEPIELTAAAIAYSLFIKYVEKTGEGLSERTLEQVGKLWQRVKGMPAGTFGALKPGRENPFAEDFEEAIREMEAMAQQNPEFKQDIIDVVAMAKEEHPAEVKSIEAEIDKNKLQEVTVEKINAVLQGNNISGGNVSNTGIFQDTTIEGSVNF